MNSRRETGATPLFLAAQYNISPDSVKLLIAAGANVNEAANVRVNYETIKYDDTHNIKKT